MAENKGLAIQFSRQQPARILTHVNHNAVGSHYEMIPVEFKQESYPLPRYRKSKRMIIERSTVYPNFNKCKETPLYPPYYNAGKYGMKSNNIYTNENNILTGTQMSIERVPVL